MASIFRALMIDLGKMKGQTKAEVVAELPFFYLTFGEAWNRITDDKPTQLGHGIERWNVQKREIK